MAGSYECGNEPSGSIKCGEFLDWLRTCYLLKKISAPWSLGLLLTHEVRSLRAVCKALTCTTRLLPTTDLTVLRIPSIYARRSAARFLIKAINMNIPCHRHLRPQNKRHEDSIDTLIFFISNLFFWGWGGPPSQVAEGDR